MAVDLQRKLSVMYYSTRITVDIRCMLGRKWFTRSILEIWMHANIGSCWTLSGISFGCLVGYV